MLILIAGIIGIIWSIVGFFGFLVGGAFVAATQESLLEDLESAERTEDVSITTMMKMIGSFFVVICGMIFGIIVAKKGTKTIPGIILSALLIICGIGAILWASYVAGPIYIICGLLGVIASVVSKEPAN